MRPIATDTCDPRISIRPLSIPGDSPQLVEIHRKEYYDPSWDLQPQTDTIENCYGPLLQQPGYEACLVSYDENTLFLLELMPIDLTDFGRFYADHPGDYFLQILPAFSAQQASQAHQALSACIASIFSGRPAISRLIFPVYYNEPGSLLVETLTRSGFTLLNAKDAPQNPDIYICLPESLNPLTRAQDSIFF